MQGELLVCFTSKPKPVALAYVIEIVFFVYFCYVRALSILDSLDTSLHFRLHNNIIDFQDHPHQLRSQEKLLTFRNQRVGDVLR